MNKSEAVALIMAKSDHWLCENITGEQFFDFIKDTVESVEKNPNLPLEQAKIDAGEPLPPWMNRRTHETDQTW